MINITNVSRPVHLCTYYQAYVDRGMSWFVVAVLKSFDHLVFDRTLDVEKSLFEFFVPASMEAEFVQIMQRLERKGLVQDLRQLPNRFIVSSENPAI